MYSPLTSELQAALAADPVDLARVALLTSRIECPRLDPSSTIAELDRLSTRVQSRLAAEPPTSIRARITAVNHVLYDLEGFRGSPGADDVRHCLLHAVIERRIGIPVSLAIVYLIVARAAGLDVFGVTFPGHFLLRVPDGSADQPQGAIILDPLDGRELDAPTLRRLWAHYGDDAPWSDALLLPCSSRQIVARVLNNLKNVYIDTRSYPHAWQAVDLLVSLGVNVPDNLRFRGLLAFRLHDFAGALNDLETYLQMTGHTVEPDEDRGQLREHVMAVRLRMAATN